MSSHTFWYCKVREMPYVAWKYVARWTVDVSIGSRHLIKTGHCWLKSWLMVTVHYLLHMKCATFLILRHFNACNKLSTVFCMVQWKGIFITLLCTCRWFSCSRAYENKLVPKSYEVPYLIMFYSDWCFACLQVEPIWRRVIEELEPVGFGVATVHAENEPLLAKKIGIHSLPSLILLMDGKASVYKETLYSVQKVVGKYDYCIH